MNIKAFVFSFTAWATTGAAAEAQPTKTADRLIRVYSSRHYDIDKMIQKNFTESSGIAVEEVQVKEASQLIERLKSEGQRTPADVLLTVDVGNLWRATEADLLAPTNDPELAGAIPQAMREPSGKWYAFTSRARVIAFNKEKVPSPQVKTYEELALPQFRGKVLSRSANHVYTQSLLAAMIFAKGPIEAEKWAQGVAQNLARKPEGNDTDQLKALAAGLGEYALVNSYYVARLMKSTDPVDKKTIAKIGFIFPNQHDRGTHINVSGGGIIKHSMQKENALKFLRYLASPAVQELLAEANNEYPVRLGVELDPVVKSFGSPRFDSAALYAIGEQTPAAVKTLDRVGWK